MELANAACATADAVAGAAIAAQDAVAVAGAAMAMAATTAAEGGCSPDVVRATEQAERVAMAALRAAQYAMGKAAIMAAAAGSPEWQQLTGEAFHAASRRGLFDAAIPVPRNPEESPVARRRELTYSSPFEADSEMQDSQQDSQQHDSQQHDSQQHDSQQQDSQQDSAVS